MIIFVSIMANFMYATIFWVTEISLSLIPNHQNQAKLVEISDTHGRNGTNFSSEKKVKPTTLLR